MKGEGLVSANFDFIIRIGVAGLLGAIIGIERKFDQRSGLKTHFLVAVGSALIMVVSKYAFQIVWMKNIWHLIRAVLQRKLLVESVFRCRYNYYSKAGGERINDSSWFMGYSRNWISNWGWYVCSRNWSDDSRFNWFRDCKPYF